MFHAPTVMIIYVFLTIRSFNRHLQCKENNKKAGQRITKIKDMKEGIMPT